MTTVTTVTQFQREQSLDWEPHAGRRIPVRSRGHLGRLIESWDTYGEGTRVRSRAIPDRQARVVSLGSDGWLVHLRDATMHKGGWPRSKLVCAVGEDGKPTPATGEDNSFWWRPDSDLFLDSIIQQEVLDTPDLAAGAAWAWLHGVPLPDGYGLFHTDFEPIEYTSLREAFDQMPDGADEWSPQMREAAVHFAGRLGVQRALVRAPYSILVQCAGSERRRHFIARDGAVIVTNLCDDLGREYTVRLPSGEIEIWDSPRSADSPANPRSAAIIALRLPE